MHALSARDGVQPGAKQYVNTLRCDGGGLTCCSPYFRSRRRPWLDFNHARRQARTHRQTQTPAPMYYTRGGDCVRDRPTDGSAGTPSARATAFIRARNDTSTRYAARGAGLTCRSRCCIRHRRPWRNCARACRHAPTHRQTQTSMPTSNTRGGGDCVRDQPTDGSARTPSVRATAFTPAQSNTSTRFAAMGGTH
jgi:hypothetical protein